MHEIPTRIIFSMITIPTMSKHDSQHIPSWFYFTQYILISQCSPEDPTYYLSCSLLFYYLKLSYERITYAKGLSHGFVLRARP